MLQGTPAGLYAELTLSPGMFGTSYMCVPAQQSRPPPYVHLTRRCTRVPAGSHHATESNMRCFPSGGTSQSSASTSPASPLRHSFSSSLLRTRDSMSGAVSSCPSLAPSSAHFPWDRERAPAPQRARASMAQPHGCPHDGTLRTKGQYCALRESF